MVKIFQSKNFYVDASERPLIDRQDGGHVRIFPNEKTVDIQQLSPKQAIELMRLEVVAGQAMAKVMNENGVDIGRINYEDLGNWSVFKPEGPHLHVHLYGRSKSAKIQKYGQALYLPHRDDNPEFYKNNKPLTEEDCNGIKKEIEKLLKQNKFSDSAWGL